MQPLLLDDAQLSYWLHQYLLPFVRLGAMFMAMPVLGARVVPARIRVGLAALLTIIVAPLLPPLQVPDLLSLQTGIFVVQELMLGIAMGFIFQVFFQVFVLAGQYLAIKMGLGFASMNDPVNGVQTTVLSQFYLVMVTVLFVSSGGHLVMIEMLLNSFQTLPPTQLMFTASKAHDVVHLGGWLFASALVIALPVLTALLVVNIAFGVMSRAAPQLNIFSIGFPFTLMCGMLLVWLGLDTLMLHFDGIFVQGFGFARGLLEAK